VSSRQLLAGGGFSAGGATGAKAGGRHRLGTVISTRLRLPVAAAVAAALLSATLFGRWGLLSAPLVGVAAGVATRILNRRRTAETSDPKAIALLLDLVASALEAGLPPDAALSSVTESIACSAGSKRGQELSAAARPLQQLGRLLKLGADPVEAWSELENVSGYQGVAAAGRRCARSGARLAGSLRSAASDLRAQRHSDGVSRAERVGVWSLLPLGLCFLPAFVCIGIAPVIIGVAGTVLSTRAP
jgi:pilus assembly protein TadC